MLISQMILNLVVAMMLGALVGLEREFVGKEAGVRTSMMVAAGAAIFSMIGMSLVTATGAQEGVALNVIANIVIGIGFLGGGIIVKNHEHVSGLTTAAVVWVVAAIGVLCGIGQLEFAVVSGVLITLILYILRTLNLEVRNSGKN